MYATWKAAFHVTSLFNSCRPEGTVKAGAFLIRTIWPTTVLVQNTLDVGSILHRAGSAPQVNLWII
jgi:hypothetical protein